MRSSEQEITNHLHQSQKKWFAIYTKYKCEKFVVDKLLKKNIEAYIPLLKTTKRYTRKIKTYEVPLLNCYVFVKIDKTQYVKVLETEYVMKFIKQRRDLISIPDEEILLLKQIVGEFQEKIEFHPDEFVEGQEVEIIGGSLTGLNGILVEEKNKNLFVVQLNHIGVQLRIDINTGLLRPINQLIKA